MNTWGLQALGDQRGETRCAFYPVAMGAVALGVSHEVRVAVVQTEVSEAHLLLLPADHAIGVVA
ncbi:hypothetical protein D3C81_1980320 [compost metagenome]